MPDEASKKQVKHIIKLSSSNLNTSFDFSSFLINTSDRIIRVYDAKEVIACGKDGEPEPIQKLQDLVNKYETYETFFFFFEIT